MAQRSDSTLALALSILGLVLVGGALIALLWDTLNELMSGVVDGRRLLVSVPVAILFFLLLRWVARTIERWHARP